MLLRTLSVAIVCLSFPLWAKPVTVTSKANAGTTLTPSKSFKYEPSSVQGFMENQGLIEVSGVSKTVDTDIQLNRSFKSEITQNIDKETAERIIE